MSKQCNYKVVDVSWHVSDADRIEAKQCNWTAVSASWYVSDDSMNQACTVCVWDFFEAHIQI